MATGRTCQAGWRALTWQWHAAREGDGVQGLGLGTSEDRFRCVSTLHVHLGVCLGCTGCAGRCGHPSACTSACASMHARVWVHGRLHTPPSQVVSFGFVALSGQGVPHCSGVWAGRVVLNHGSSRFPQKLWDPWLCVCGEHETSNWDPRLHVSFRPLVTNPAMLQRKGAAYQPPQGPASICSAQSLGWCSGQGAGARQSDPCAAGSWLCCVCCVHYVSCVC